MDLVIIPSRHYDTVPVTNSQIIADLVHLTHNTILRYIRQEEFHRCTKHCSTCSGTNELASQTDIPLTEPQAMQIFQHINRTGEIKDAEAELARQFYEAKCQLNERRQQRAKYISSRKECIKLGRNNGMSNAANVRCRDLTHQMAFGKSTSQYRREAGIFGDSKQTIDYMSADDLYALTVAQEELVELLRTGKTYEQIETIVMTPQPETFNDVPVEKAAKKRTFRGFLAGLLRAILQYDDCA